MRRGLWYFLSAQKVQTKDELLENIRQSIIYDRTTEKQAERSQLYPFSNHLLAVQNLALGCHWRVLLFATRATRDL